MEDQLKALAAQLRCPEGESGIKLGHTMNISNLAVILHGISHLNIKDHDSILELGYGNGGLLGYILSLAKDMHYTGLEISPTMHQEATSLNAPYIQANLAQYLLYDGITLPFHKPEFDKVLTVNTIYFWQQPFKLLESICQALKPNGLLNITFCDKSFMQTLPFNHYGFKLYETPAIIELAQGLPLKLVNESHKTDKCITKAKSLVERKFISLVFEKTE